MIRKVAMNGKLDTGTGYPLPVIIGERDGREPPAGIAVGNIDWTGRADLPPAFRCPCTTVTIVADQVSLTAVMHPDALAGLVDHLLVAARTMEAMGDAKSAVLQ